MILNDLKLLNSSAQCFGVFESDAICRDRSFLTQTEKEDGLLSIQALLQPLNWGVSPGWERILFVLHLCLRKCVVSLWSFMHYSKQVRL